MFSTTEQALTFFADLFHNPKNETQASGTLFWLITMAIILFPHAGKRKPEPDFYLEVLRHLDVEPASCIFIDDRLILFFICICMIHHSY